MPIAKRLIHSYSGLRKAQFLGCKVELDVDTGAARDDNESNESHGEFDEFREGNGKAMVSAGRLSIYKTAWSTFRATIRHV